MNENVPTEHALQPSNKILMAIKANVCEWEELHVVNLCLQETKSNVEPIQQLTWNCN